MAKQDNSDPLPYQQIDRSARVMAARMAQVYEFSFQHALGSLSEFFEMNGDPRRLQELIAEGKDEVILDKDELVRRFKIASGKVADPADLTLLGVVEEQESGAFRVRGMSRYFAPLLKRKKGNANASLGGKKSAETRKKKFGSAVPVGASNGDAPAAKKKTKPTPAQAEIPGMPPAPPPAPRALSRQQTAEVDYQRTRRIVMVEEEGLDFVEDEKHGPAFINVALKKILDACEPLARDGASGWERLLDLWFKQPWAAKMDPPFPFSAFASDSVQFGSPDQPNRPGLLKRLAE